jgi:CRISPR-associated endoribonuclease Cas6
MPPSPRKKTSAPKRLWDASTELIGFRLTLQPSENLILPLQYTTQFHSWFLDQVRRTDFDLSTALHDGQAKKPFTVSSLQGDIQSHGRSRLLVANQPYEWTITALSQPVVQWVHQLQTPPTDIHLLRGSLKILNWQIAHPATTYAQLLHPTPDPTLTLTFTTATSFRRNGNHLPLPVPYNLFHSYLRRWNDFSGQPIDQDDFLHWVDKGVVILRQVQSAKVMAGKSGSVTGFIGAVQLGLSHAAKQHTEYVQLWQALGQLAPYCGTGHKTPFGLGQTRLGWFDEAELPDQSPLQNLVADAFKH